ncbi:GreA/GreB family elongation factor [Oceanithermus desulfurans]|uniref:Transcription inhibitor protein Gfh1 n=2 Tax=Oceanithermus desulfurans TaxID=227924 RepID=A0A511RJY2_9DEIN|nr:GreA/GreB family elongation factor [Oceanithermus desulfurans]MBB6030312.1 transcription elongation factor GreA [Oceanithermus desulfurans]GEM89387.1 transcription inhibitor protein Gfh1 [Oceanithermus desulfurans NBRC 100063]
MAREVKLTKAGYERLQEELAEEKKRLEEATRILQEQMESFEDYEDSGLEEAKREKAQIEARVDALEDILHHAVIIESAEGDKVTLGSVVVVQDEKTGESLTLQIVAPAEATVLEEPMRVSDESPLGKALLGRKEGDKIRVDTPSGKRRYRILSVGA